MELQVWKKLEGDRVSGLGVRGGLDGDLCRERECESEIECQNLIERMDDGLRDGQDGLEGGQGLVSGWILGCHGSSVNGGRLRMGQDQRRQRSVMRSKCFGLGNGQAHEMEKEWRLSSASKRELKWWRKHASDWLPVEMDSVWKIKHEMIFADSSDFAFGSSNGLWGRWKEDEMDWIIAIKELETIRRLVCSLDNDAHYTIYCDNSVVFWSLMRGRSFSKDINTLVKRIGGDAFKRGLKLRIRWVPSEDNKADWISRSVKRPQMVDFVDNHLIMEGKCMPEWGQPGREDMGMFNRMDMWIGF